MMIVCSRNAFEAISVFLYYFMMNLERSRENLVVKKRVLSFNSWLIDEFLINFRMMNFD